jgi:rhomboid protease GluP
MSTDAASDLPDLPTDPSVVRRDRLLGALFSADSEMSLLQHRPEFSLLVSPNAPPQIFLLPTRDRDAVDRLPRLAAEIVRVASAGAVPTHIVAVGGGPAVAQALAGASKKTANVAFGFHHVDDASVLTHIAGDKLDVLNQAAERIKTSEAPSPDVLRSALIRGKTLVEREQQAVAKLRGQTPLTYVLITVCGLIALFAYAKAGSSKLPYREIVAVMGATHSKLVHDGDIWRLFTSMFLHWDVTHILVNMLALFNLGQLLEPILGPRRFFILYGLSGLGAALVTTNLGPDRLSAGASGAIWGLMTAVLAIVIFPRGLLPPLLVARLKSSAWRPLVLNIFLSFVPGIDLLAHFGGGICGFVLTIAFLGGGLVPVDARVPGTSIETVPRPWLTGLAVLLGLAMVASLGIGIWTVSGWQGG